MEQTMQADFFVATDGDDGWSGKLDAPNADKTDGPFATLVRARDAIRESKPENGFEKPVTVMVRGGKYFVERTLVLEFEDSGTRDCPITYTAYPGEKPVLSGGRKVEGWKPYKGEILQCELPEARGGNWKFRQLFFNGKRQIRARYPDFDHEDPIYGGWLFTAGPNEEGDKKPLGWYAELAKGDDTQRSFKYKPGTFKRHWAKPRQAEVFMLSGSGLGGVIPVKTIDEENCLITLTRPIKDWMRVPYNRHRGSINPGNPFYVENVLEELDRPGEWCLDGEDGVLYFWPPEPIEGAEVVVPVLDCLIELRGTSWNGPSWLTVSGFTFTETTTGDNMHREGNEGYGAMSPEAGEGRTYCGEALHIRGAAHCRVEDNRFYAVGGNAVYVEDHAVRNVIRNNEISHAGAIGISLAGTKYFCPRRHYPYYNEVTDNHIHHCGVFDKYSAGIFLGMSDSNTIAHNLIEHLPHHGINLGNSQFGRNIIEYNELRDICLQTFDNGAINAWGEDPWGHVQKDAERSGHIIRHNLVIDVHAWERGEKGSLGPCVWMKSVREGSTHGIYLDNFVSNCFVYGNIVVRSGSSGIYLQGGKNNIVENNIVVDVGNLCHLGGWWQTQMGEPSFMTGNRFCRNIYYRSAGDPLVLYRHISYKDEPLSDALAESDHNLLFSKSGGEFIITENTSFLSPELPTLWPAETEPVTLDEWRKEGFETNSVTADPMFVDPDNDDYRLKPGSPALGLGFQPIDVNKIGLRTRKRDPDAAS